METATNLSFKCPHCKKQLKEFKGSSQTIIEKLDELKKKYSSFKNSLEAGKK
jgi:transcription initiation factor IIE alpha subunit